MFLNFVSGPETVSIKKPDWKMTTALPEDYAVHMMKAVKESAVKTCIDLTKPYEELTALQQVHFGSWWLL